MIQTFKQLIRSIKYVSREYGYSRFFLFNDFCFKFIFLRTTPKQYIALGLYALNFRTVRHFVRFRQAQKIERTFNNEKEGDEFLTNKANFNTRFASFVKRDWVDCSVCSEQDIAAFFEKHKNGIAKPSTLSGGRGIHFVHSAKEALTLVGKPYLLEEIIINHHSLRKLSDSSLNTCRIFVLKTKSGNFEILSASLRIGAPGSAVDNMHGGGHAVKINVANGNLEGPGKDYEGRRYLINPQTKNDYNDIKIPYWDSIIKGVKEAASSFSHCRYTSWDVAATETGFEFIEGNVHSDPILLQLFVGPMLKKFKRER